MSVIHNALSQTDANNPSHSPSNFNPLNRRATQKEPFPVKWILSFVLIVAAALLFLLPEQSVSLGNATSLTESDSSPTATVQTAETRPSVETLPSVLPELPISDESTEPVEGDTSRPPVEQGSIISTLSDSTDNTQTTTSELTVLTDDVQQPEVESVASSIPSEPVTQSTERAQPAVKKAETTEQSNLVNSDTSVQPSVHANTVTPETETSIEPITSDAQVVRLSQNNWQQQVTQHIAQGEIEQAEAVLKSWIGAAPKDPAPRIWLAKIYINNGFYLAAEPLLTTVTETEAKALLGIIYERTDRAALAAVTFEELFRTQPDQGKWLLFWAINSENSQQLAKSQTLYQNYITLFAPQDERLTQFAQQRLRALEGR